MNDQKTAPRLLSTSSSKKRKSIPQKIIMNNNHDITKKFHNDSTLIENDSYDQTNQQNESINEFC